MKNYNEILQITNVGLPIVLFNNNKSKNAIKSFWATGLTEDAGHYTAQSELVQRLFLVDKLFVAYMVVRCTNSMNK